MAARVLFAGAYRSAAEVEALIEQCVHARTYKRDSKGRFGSGSGVTTGGDGIREVLRGHGTAEEVATAAAAEAARITGRTGSRAISFDMTGSDPQLAAEHSEGILRGLERYPGAQLDSVGMLSPQGKDGFYGNAIAVTFPPSGSSGTRIKFNPRFAGDPAHYQAMLEKGKKIGHFADPTPTSMAVHEFGHVLTHQGDSAAAAWSVLDRAGKARGVDPSDVAHDVSGYARTDSHELAAESFAAVMAHGTDAHPIAQRVVAEIDKALLEAARPSPHPN